MCTRRLPPFPKIIEACVCAFGFRSFDFILSYCTCFHFIFIFYHLSGAPNNQQKQRHNYFSKIQLKKLVIVRCRLRELLLFVGELLVFRPERFVGVVALRRFFGGGCEIFSTSDSESELDSTSSFLSSSSSSWCTARLLQSKRRIETTNKRDV